MFEFSDSTGDKWTLALPFGEVLRVKEQSKGQFDLLDPHANDLAKRLDEDLVLFWELLQMLTADQQKERKLSAKDFGQRMAGDCLLAALHEFFKAWADFFRRIQRLEQAIALEQISKLRELAIAKVKTRLEQSELLKALPGRVAAKVDQHLTSAFSDLQESFDSILGPSPGASSGTATRASKGKRGR
jgi:hypothetical protein